MQDDIIDRLRDKATQITKGPMMSTVRQTLEWEAADEINALRAEINELEEKIYGAKRWVK